MDIVKFDGSLVARFDPEEIATMLVSKFFTDLANSKNPDIQDQIKKMSKSTVDSHDYEFFVAILDLYTQFEKRCKFCFKLKDKFDYKTHQILSIKDLYEFRDDPPDVIIFFERNYYEFELKRYRGEINLNSLHDFVINKIIRRYKGKTNFLIILQPTINMNLSLNVFKQLHDLLKVENFTGMIGFSLNNNNEEMMIFRVFPELEASKRKFEHEISLFADLLHD